MMRANKNHQLLIFLVILVYADTLIVEEFPSLWILCNFKLLSNLTKLLKSVNSLMMSDYHEYLRVILEVLRVPCIFYNV